MTETSAGQYFWCLRHSRVESGDDVCPAKYRLGPYSTSAEAERALDRVQQRNEKWDAEDERWENG
ncbi:MAG: hypothetical protein JWO79_4092 [Actinomycetia bacterium]|jgi:hypothetical protein|nr:hypothetical protein [Actinomycetes bacterium]MDQ1645469.1 hypothetical protein [Cryptosporangiaceae bacterium]